MSLIDSCFLDCLPRDNLIQACFKSPGIRFVYVIDVLDDMYATLHQLVFQGGQVICGAFKTCVDKFIEGFRGDKYIYI